MVVLNWNGAADTLECLRSLSQCAPPVYAIVVDNGSDDDSVERIEESGLAQLVIRAGQNLGFAEGNNVGLRHALTQGFPLIAVLNNDTTVEPDAFAVLQSHLETTRHCAVSPDIRYAHDASQSWFAGGVVDNGWPRHLQSNELSDDSTPLRRSDILTGCCIAASRETWARVGLFDPRYFLIFEDSDWSLRARAQGVPLFVVPGSRIYHKVSRSFASGPMSLLGSFYFVRNGLRFEAEYARTSIGRFFVQWLIRPTLLALVRRRNGREMLFRWLGAGAFVVRQCGRAPSVVDRLALHLMRTMG